MFRMFYNASSFNQLLNFDMSNVTNVNRMFTGTCIGQND